MEKGVKNRVLYYIAHEMVDGTVHIYHCHPSFSMQSTETVTTLHQYIYRSAQLSNLVGLAWWINIPLQDIWQSKIEETICRMREIDKSWLVIIGSYM